MGDVSDMMSETETIAAEIYWNRVWYWNKYLGERKGHRCRILATGRMNSALIEFDDGYKVLSSRYAVRKDPKHLRIAKNDHAFMR